MFINNSNFEKPLFQKTFFKKKEKKHIPFFDRRWRGL